MADWISAAEAAERLGIKQASLYAYVSRGILGRRREAGGRASIFDAAEVEELARRGRPRRKAGQPELVIETEVTEITASGLRYRGHDAIELAMTRTFEDVAVLLWTGTLPESVGATPAGSYGDAPAGVRQPDAWRATPEAIAAGSAAQAALPAMTLPLERMQVIVPALAATDPFRLHLDRNAVMAAGKALTAGLVAALPIPAAHGIRAAGTTPSDQAATRQSPNAGALPAGAVAVGLAAKLCTRAVPLGLAGLLNAALVLTADHELAASTLAGRVAASMRADPYAVVATALGPMSGALHGGASLGAEDMLAAAMSPTDAPRLVGDVLRRGERLAGFGHFVYEDRDPRASLLLGLLADYAPGSSQFAIASALIDEVGRRSLPAPNIEFALAVLARVAGMVRGAGEAIFATGRTAGWLAHALEEYGRNIAIRPRAIYTGDRASGYNQPGSAGSSHSA